jgi:multiple sugar transport system permease protein
MGVIRLRSVSVNLAVAGLALATVAPLLWMVSVSLMPRGMATSYPPPLWPPHPTLANYRELLFAQDTGAGATDFRIVPAFFNSLYLAGFATLIGLATTVPAGYAFAKLRFRGRNPLLRLLLVLVVVPTQVSLLPLFLILKYAGLVNTYLGVLAPGFAGIYGVLFVRQATLTIPDEMLDAARIDGASEWRIFVHIVWPLLRPITFTLALFTFLTSWSDFLWPLIVVTDQGLYTLPVALAAISREHAQDVELMMAGAVVTTLPVLLLFLALQRSYLTGLLSGGIKG